MQNILNMWFSFYLNLRFIELIFFLFIFKIQAFLYDLIQEVIYLFYYMYMEY